MPVREGRVEHDRVSKRRERSRIVVFMDLSCFKILYATFGFYVKISRNEQIHSVLFKQKIPRQEILKMYHCFDQKSSVPSFLESTRIVQ